MADSNPVLGILQQAYHDLEGIAPGLHLLCPKIDENDEASYDDPEVDELGVTSQEKKQRIQDAAKRREVVYRLSLMLGIDDTTASTWFPYWSDRVSAYLTKCDRCVRNWHSTRAEFIAGLKDQVPEDAAARIEQKLAEFDASRIQKGLQRAKEIIEAKGAMPATKLVRHDMSAGVALFDALFSMAYLATPGNRSTFNFVFEKTQQKRALRMTGKIIPIMTWFLFDPDFYRNRFALAAWDELPEGSLDAETWDWAVQTNLLSAMKDVWPGPVPIPPDKLCRFWKGFLVILKSMDEWLILERLRPLDINVYLLALDHAKTQSEEALILVMQGLQILMEKSPKAFWDACDQVTPSQVAHLIIGGQAFRRLLDKSLIPENMVQEGDNYIPMPAAWIRTLFRSLPLDRQSDLCEPVLEQLFITCMQDPSSTPEARATCTLAGLLALGESLSGYLSTQKVDASTGLFYVNCQLSRVVGYKDVIITAAEMKTHGDRFNVGISTAAMTVVNCSLTLDAKATEIEWSAIRNTDKAPQNLMSRNSGALWEGFLEMLWPGRVELARNMLMATMHLRAVERFMPLRKGVLNPAQKQFNDLYQRQAAAIGKILGRLTDFTAAELHTFCSDMHMNTIHPIAASLIHGEPDIREAGIELIKTITGESQLSEATNKMLEEYLGPFLDAFSASLKKLMDPKLKHETDGGPWSPMRHVLECSDNVLNGLCDPSVGQLRMRSHSLSPGELAIVQGWWQTSWQAIDHCFDSVGDWHHRVEKKVLEDFCRSTMELADKLIEQEGLMVSVVSQHGKSSAAVMRSVLQTPQENLKGMTKMLQLRDKYLIAGVVGVLVKLLNRLREINLELPDKVSRSITNVCKKNSKGMYNVRTNLTDDQRIELLKALGDDGEIEIQFLGSAPAKDHHDKALRQGKLDFTKSGPSTGIRPENTESSRTHGLDKSRSSLAALKVRDTPKALVSQQPPQSISAFKQKRLKEQEELKKRKEEAVARAQALRAPVKTVPGEGSGLQGIAGVRGKAHAPAQKDEMMMGSSSEDEDDDDDDEDELLAKHRAGQMTKEELERRRQLALLERQRGPVKKVKVQRSAKDMRARLIPPMDVLHQAILEWDIFHHGNDPPNGFKCSNVMEKYAHPVEYKQTFFPLLINEAWQSFRADLSEMTNKPFGVKVVNRMTVDKFLEVSTMIPFGQSRERVVSEGDIVILSMGQNPATEQDTPHCLARVWKTRPKNNMLEVVFRVNSKNNGFSSVLLGGAEIHAVRITNMTTIEREYAALESLQYYDLMDEVLKAAPSPILNFGDEALRNVMDIYQLNLGQAKAILNARANDGFTLIQGPPGTGKTKTIVAMVGCLLTGILKSGPEKAVPVQRLMAGPPNGRPPAKKLLICAPSNAAVDELVLRLKAGVKTTSGAHHKVEVLRLGRSDAINAAVKDVTLDELVTARLNVETGKVGNVGEREKLHQEAGDIKVKIGELMPALEAARASGDRDEINRLQREYDGLKQRRAQIGAKIEDNKSSGNTYARELQIKRLQIQQEILDKAHVLCATLSGSGHEMFKDLNVEFETVIIDEAAQCVELSALIPLKYGCAKCILVGDPKQLPPTVLSQSASRFGFSQSLFVRMQKNHAQDVHLLDMQYRMHPEISQFPSREFYEGLLQDGDDMARLRSQPWHQSGLLGPYRFFDVKGNQNVGSKGRSFTNSEEINVAMQLYQRFLNDYRDIDMKGKIGIITPYKAQLHMLRNRFESRYGDDIKNDIDFNTADAFQGRECEIIIFSCVRADADRGIGFLNDIRRMNVGLTRARSSLWILGDSRALVQGEFWARLIQNARERDRYTSGDIMRLLSQPGPKVAAAMPPPRDTRGEDTVMTDAYPLPSHVGGADQGPASALGFQKSSSSSTIGQYRGSGIGGVDAKGMSVPVASRGPATLPIIQTAAAAKKRQLDGGDSSAPPAKKQQNNEAFKPPPPRGPKADRKRQEPPHRGSKADRKRQEPPPTDPSAMEVLGLVPPERPPAAPSAAPSWTGYGAGQGPPTTSGAAPRPAPRGPPPKKKKKADPFIRRK